MTLKDSMIWKYGIISKWTSKLFPKISQAKVAKYRTVCTVLMWCWVVGITDSGDENEKPCGWFTGKGGDKGLFPGKKRHSLCWVWLSGQRQHPISFNRVYNPPLTRDFLLYMWQELTVLKSVLGSATAGENTEEQKGSCKPLWRQRSSPACCSGSLPHSLHLPTERFQSAKSSRFSFKCQVGDVVHEGGSMANVCCSDKKARPCSEHSPSSESTTPVQSEIRRCPV